MTLKTISIVAVLSIIGCCVGPLVYKSWRKVKLNRLKSKNARHTMEFEFGETRESKLFFDRNPKFLPMFERLMELANKYLSNRPQPKNQAEDICFGLGHACRQDFLEVVFLAVNGYGVGASKLTRGLYERSVTLAYLVQDQTRVERFVRYAAVQEHRSLEAALDVVSPAEFDAFMGSPNTEVEIRKRFQEIKPEFEMTLCKKCGTKRTRPSWDIEIAGMVHKLGGLYRRFYLPNYSVPNFEIHATLASSVVKTDQLEVSRREADLQVVCASFLMLLALRSQELLFHLGLESELEGSEEAINNLRPPRG